MSLLGSSATTWTGISVDTFRNRLGRRGPLVRRDPAPEDKPSRSSARPKPSLLSLADCGLLLRALDLLRAAFGFLLAGLDLHEANAGIAAVDPDQLDFAPVWAAVQPPPATTVGMHRYLWDFQYAALPGEPESNSGQNGPFAPPGRYAVRMTYCGRTYAQPLVVAKDPRVHASDADLIAQFSLARQIEKLRIEAAAARVTAMSKKRSSLAGGPPPLNPDVSVGVPPKDFTSLYAVGNELDALEADVESADAAPTSDEYAAFAHWRAVLRADEAQLR